ncbi:hypothetical protein NQ318_011603 [Aromia moschata]|uniref:Farnesol dehydrogenase n=1 Tax=Aromia moschata TaxID=1265417 RepID=A0AAV8Z7V9_9CUCU|nr:hypothetical protein NQ318_011603 [Aromia moschata]
MVLSMERWIGKVAVVTGASSGIGAAIAKRLVEEGLIVVGLARRSEIIEEHAKKLSDKKGKLYAVKTDMAKEEDILNAFKWITTNLGPIHILVNNAAIHMREELWNGNTETWRKTVDVNVIGLCIATREAIKIMKENNIDGHIIHINSIVGHKVLTLKYLDIYCATKFAVTALAETLRLELNSLKSKIKITRTQKSHSSSKKNNMHCRALAQVLLIPKSSLRNTERMREFKKLLEGALKPEDIADGAVYVLSTPPHVQIQELTIKPVGESL